MTRWDLMTGVVSTSSCGRNSTMRHKGREEGEYVTGEITAAPVIIKLKWHDFMTCHSIAAMNELYKHTRGVFTYRTEDIVRTLISLLNRPMMAYASSVLV